MIYLYFCKKCNVEFEATQKIIEPPLLACPVCKEPHPKKLIAPCSFSLKGGGWASSGYKSTKE